MAREVKLHGLSRFAAVGIDVPTKGKGGGDHAREYECTPTREQYLAWVEAGQEEAS